MNNISIKTIAAVAGISLLSLGTSCNKLKDFDTTNANPAAVTDPIPYALLTNVQWQLGGFASNASPILPAQRLR